MKKIVVPASVKKVESDKYYALDERGLDKRTVNGRITGLQVNVKSKQLDDSSLSQLLYYLEMDLDTLMKQLSDRISVKDDMYTTNTNVLLGYGGKDWKRSGTHLSEDVLSEQVRQIINISKNWYCRIR